jgi:hypothetical protein
MLHSKVNCDLYRWSSIVSVEAMLKTRMHAEF